jgi:hypothetical protein
MDGFLCSCGSLDIMVIQSKHSLKNTWKGQHWTDAFPEMLEEIMLKKMENWLKGMKDGQKEGRSNKKS